jgi:hypothetical protein
VNNVNPVFKQTLDQLIEPAQDRKERRESPKVERLKLLVISANAIIDGVMAGKYGTITDALQAIEDWRAGVMAEGIKLES